MTSVSADTATVNTPFTIQRVNYLDASDSAALRAMLAMYAQDPMGGGAALAPEALERLCADLAERSFAFSFLAWRAGQAIGLVNCFEAYSTFKARALVNIHDLAVRPSARGMGVGQALLDAVQTEALLRGACKLTLEVLTGNGVARKATNALALRATSSILLPDMRYFYKNCYRLIWLKPKIRFIIKGFRKYGVASMHQSWCPAAATNIRIDHESRHSPQLPRSVFPRLEQWLQVCYPFVR